MSSLRALLRVCFYPGSGCRMLKRPGQTSWIPPQGVFIVPRQPEGEWWELADTSRGNRSYFYNTMTRKTQWTRPDANQFVIPLGLIQVSRKQPVCPVCMLNSVQSSASPESVKRRSRHISVNSTKASHLRANDPMSPLVRSRHQSQPPHGTALPPGPRPPASPRRSQMSDVITPTKQLKTKPPGPLTTMPDPSSPRSDGEPITPPNTSGFPRTLSVVGEGEEPSDRGTSLEVSESGNEADHSIISEYSAQSDQTIRTAGTAKKVGMGRFGGTRFEEKRKTSNGFLGLLSRPGRSRTASANHIEIGQENGKHENLPDKESFTLFRS